jgi:hypothetical protein
MEIYAEFHFGTLEKLSYMQITGYGSDFLVMEIVT